MPEPASFVATPDDASATAVVVTGADRRVLAPRWPRTSLVQVVAGRVYLSTPRALGCGSDNVVVPLGGGAPRPAFKDDPGWVAFSVSGDGTRVVALQRPGRTGTDCGVGRPFDLILRGDGPERSFPLASRGADVGLVLDSAGRGRTRRRPPSRCGPVASNGWHVECCAPSGDLMSTACG